MLELGCAEQEIIKRLAADGEDITIIKEILKEIKNK